MRTCSHCRGPLRGSAGLTTDGVHYPLCHPDEGLDCYRLVTVYQHPAKDCPCEAGVMPDEWLRSRNNGFIGTFATLDEAIAAVRKAVDAPVPKEER